jgi:hypothetical protein
MNISMILTIKYPDSEWICDGDEYSGLTWLSESPKPTEDKLIELWPKVQKELAEKTQAKIDSKESAISKLKALGLTVDEVELAFGLKS